MAGRRRYARVDSVRKENGDIELYYSNRYGTVTHIATVVGEGTLALTDHGAKWITTGSVHKIIEQAEEAERREQP